MHMHTHHRDSQTDSLLVDALSLHKVEDEEVISAVGGEDFEGAVPEEVAPLVNLANGVVGPLDAAKGREGGREGGRERGREGGRREREL